jgi:SHS2 domain-containing protein
MRQFEEIPHTADWSFRAFGHDLAELFENSALAVFSMEGAVPLSETEPETTRTVEVSGIDYESLLVNWLSELLYMQESNRETYYHFRIETLSPTRLQARVSARRDGKIDKLVKAVTYHNLKIEQTGDEWQAVIVVDV